MTLPGSKWCNGPCGRQLPSEAFYALRTGPSSFCRRCDNVRRVGAFKARYSSPSARLKYLKRQRDRRHRRALARRRAEASL